MKHNTIEQSSFVHLFTASTASAPFWFLVRLYVGYEWLRAGWDKVMNPGWFGSGAGAAIKGFVAGALSKTTGAHPDVQMWYASFLNTAVLPYPVVWSNAIAIGEVLVGLGLIVGLFTGIAAFFGFFMNMNFLLAGTVSTNPAMLLLALALILSRRVSGYWGLDRWAMPLLRRTFRRHSL